MKKIKLLIAGAAVVGLMSTSIAFADGFAPGEGLYLGAFAGVGTGIVQPKVVTTNTLDATQDDQGGTFEATEGGLGLQGIEGGGWIGYGYKMGDLYAGLEGEIAAGDVEFKLTSDIDIRVNPTGTETVKEVKATKDWTGGAFGRVGYYVNDDTLLSVRGGVLVSKFDVSYTGYSETFYGGGPSMGASLTSRISAIDPNLSVRMGMVYTDFLTAPVSGLGSANPASSGANEGVNSEITGSALSARFGVSYSFLDVNSLF